MMITRIFKVTVCSGPYHDEVCVAASDDVEARQKAISRWLEMQEEGKAQDEESMSEKDIEYCEIELLAETD